MSEKEMFAYLTGLFEGEGSISAVKRSKLYKCKISQTNVKLTLGMREKKGPKMFKEFFGVGSLNYESTGGTNHWGGGCWYWTVSGKAGENVVRDMMPHLKLKKEQAKLFLEFRNHVSPSNYEVGRENAIERLHIVRKIQELNATKSNSP